MNIARTAASLSGLFAGGGAWFATAGSSVSFQLVHGLARFAAGAGTGARTPCDVTMRLPLHGFNANVTITADGSNVLAVRGVGAQLDFGEGALQVGATFADVHLVDVRAQSIVVDAQHGQVVLHGIAASASVALGRSAPATCSLQSTNASADCGSIGGDIYISMRRDALSSRDAVFVVAEQTQGVICVAAARVDSVASNNASCDVPVPGANATAGLGLPSTGLQCHMELMTCTNASVPCSSSPKYTVLALARNGGVYYSIEDPALALSDYTAVDGGAFTNGVALDAAGTAALSALQEFIDKEPNSDVVATLDLDVQNAGVWMFATRLVFLQLLPHWLAALSASLMMPRTHQIQARLFPGAHGRAPLILARRLVCWCSVHVRVVFCHPWRTQASARYPALTAPSRFSGHWTLASCPTRS